MFLRLLAIKNITKEEKELINTYLIASANLRQNINTEDNIVTVTLAIKEIRKILNKVRFYYGKHEYDENGTRES